MRNYFYIIICIIIVIFFILFLLDPILKTENTWMCSITKSKKSSTSWIFGITTNQKHEISLLERRLFNKNRRIDHKWVKIEGTSKTLLGTIHDHERAPAILYFPDKLFNEWAMTSNEQEIENFIYVMSNGSRKGQEDIVRQMAEKILKK